MTKLSPTQHADAARRCDDILTKMRAAMNGPEYQGDARLIMLDIRDLVVANGWPVVGFAARAWCDAVIDATPDNGIGRPVVVAFATPDQTELVDTVHVTAERRWCAELLAARFAADQITVHTLIDRLPRDNATLVYLFRMAEIAAGVLNEYAKDPIGPLAPGLYRETAPGVYTRAGDQT